jgi:hypothetical protein
MENIPVSGLLSPISTSDNYPIIDPTFGIDGLRNVSSTQSMYDIPLERRRAGMVVGIADNVSGNVTYFKLKPQVNGVTWSIGDSTNWNGFLSSGTASIPVKHTILNETLEVPENYMYVVYGDLLIGATGVLNNFGRTVVLNGNLVTQSNGVLNTLGSGQFITASFYVQKVVKTFSSVANVGITVSHNLNTTDFTYTLRDGYNFVYGNVELASSDASNKVIVTCATSINYITMTIVG